VFEAGQQSVLRGRLGAKDRARTVYQETGRGGNKVSSTILPNIKDPNNRRQSKHVKTLERLNGGQNNEGKKSNHHKSFKSLVSLNTVITDIQKHYTRANE